MARGRLITIEGGEGAGKSTQTALLAAALERAGLAVRATREPGGSPGAEAVRRLLLEGEAERWDAVGEALLLLAARRDHVARLIRPALDAGELGRLRPLRRIRPWLIRAMAAAWSWPTWHCCSAWRSAISRPT